jgi:DNA-binding transcriptional ArsR family regulator
MAAGLDQTARTTPLGLMAKTLTREQAADACLDILDTAFFVALCEPVRVELVRALVLKGRSDIQTIAEGFSQDRSVIARHLQVLARAGLVRSEKVGRHQFFELDGPAIVTRMETMTAAIRQIMPLCCP